jgi:UDP-2,3-diacylglucosamine hydrolase
LETLFISDLHLSLERPAQLAMFKQLLQGPARKAGALYILGDLFEEFWVGNDDTTPPNPEIVHELADYAGNGGKLYLVKGNRDLLLDDGFGELTGGILLADKTVIDLDGVPVLIMHGDLLCTRDRQYQIYRRVMTNPIIQGIFAVLPYQLRIMLARGLKPVMKRSVMNKPDGIIDVDQDTVEQVMRVHKVTELIHGHTHRPGVHDFNLDGRPARRIVLGDWYGQDRILVCRGGERKLMQTRDYLQQHS